MVLKRGRNIWKQIFSARKVVKISVFFVVRFVVRIFADTWSKILSGYKDRYFYGQICGHIRLNPFIYQYFRHFRRIGISAKRYI